jgi:RND family efflux transporter MFP subunit
MVAVPLLVLAGAAATFAYLRATRPHIPPRPPQERVWTVATAAARAGADRPVYRLFGEIVAGREAELRPLVAGRVIAVGPDFVNGGTVHKGDLLIEIDPFDYQAAVDEREADLAEARARLDEFRGDLGAERALLDGDERQLRLARDELDRRQRLLKTGAGTQKALDDARLAVTEREQRVLSRRQGIERLEARIAQTEATVDRLRVLLRRARRDLEQTRQTAPFDGFLEDTAAAEGKRVSTGDRIARLIDARRLEARFQVSDGEYARMIADGDLRGRSATVIWRAGESPFTFDAIIDRAESRIDAAAGGVLLYARLDGLGLDTPLRPGAFVAVEVPDRTYQDVVRLPERALHGGDTVYVVDESAAPGADGRLAARTVDLVARDGADVLIRGAFAPGERIVTTRFPEIGPGVRVTLPDQAVR